MITPRARGFFSLRFVEKGALGPRAREDPDGPGCSRPTAGSGASVVAPLGGSSAPSTPVKKEEDAKMEVDTPNGGSSDSDEKPSAKKDKKKKVSVSSSRCVPVSDCCYFTTIDLLNACNAARHKSNSSSSSNHCTETFTSGQEG